MLSILGTKTGKAMVIGLGAIMLSACAYDHHGHYNGGGYYYGDHYKKYYGDRDNHDGRRDRDRRFDRKDYGRYDGDRNDRHRDKRAYRDLDRAYDQRDDGREYRHRGRGRDHGEEKYEDHYGRGGYDRGYRVCDSDGDRCYLSSNPYWDYRQYYRNHGYRWDDE